MADLNSVKAELKKVLENLEVPDGLGSGLMREWIRYLPALASVGFRLDPKTVVAALSELPQVAAILPTLSDLFGPVDDGIVIPQSDDRFKVTDVFYAGNTNLGIISVSEYFTAVAGGIAVDPKSERQLESFDLRCATANADARRVLGDGCEADFAAVRELLRAHASSVPTGLANALVRHSYRSNVFYLGGDLVFSCHCCDRGQGKKLRIALHHEVECSSKWPEGTRFFRSKK